MPNATCCKVISRWQQCISPGHAQTWPSMLHCHIGMTWGKTTFQTWTLLNNVKSSTARSKITDVATMVMEEWHRPSREDWLTDFSFCVAEGIQHPHAMRLYHSAVWTSRADMNLKIYLYELTASFLCCMLGKEITNWKAGKCLQFWYGKCI